MMNGHLTPSTQPLHARTAPHEDLEVFPPKLPPTARPSETSAHRVTSSALASPMTPRDSPPPSSLLSAEKIPPRHGLRKSRRPVNASSRLLGPRPPQAMVIRGGSNQTPLELRVCRSRQAVERGELPAASGGLVWDAERPGPALTELIPHEVRNPAAILCSLRRAATEATKRPAQARPERPGLGMC